MLTVAAGQLLEPPPPSHPSQGSQINLMLTRGLEVGAIIIIRVIIATSTRNQTLLFLNGR